MFRILVIDDDVDLLFLGTSMLRQKGFDVMPVSKSDEIDEKIREFNPELILLDVKLGDADGRDICLALKEDAATRDIKIILYSAFPETSVEYTKYKADDFIVKPYKADHLITRIQHFLANKT
jgi:DNA-binding response OmpR family regulator